MASNAEALSRFNEGLEAELERAIAEAARGPAPWVEAVQCAGDLLRAGGKRIRPRLLLLSYLACGGAPVGSGVIRFAAGIELIHTCMLIHDDVMDRALLRRGVASIHRAVLERGLLGDPRLAEGVAIVVGDVLVSLATEALVPEELDVDVARRASAVVHRSMGETAAGQLLDLIHSGRAIEEVDEEEILEACRLKTACFAFEAPLRSGAVLASAGDAVADALARFGLLLGTAFQLRDDLIGLMGDQPLTGKRAVDDLREGKKTLVLRSLHQRCSEEERALIGDILGRREPTEGELERLRALVRGRGVLEEVEGRIAAMSAEAIEALSSVELVDAWRGHLLLLARWLEGREQ